VDLQLGKDSEGLKTFNNTRAVQVNGAIGKTFNFSTSFYESQGRFASYFNEYAESIKPSGGNPAIIPGRGIAKPFQEDAYDYPVAEAYISYTPSSHFNFQFGRGKNFIGDGYRSLFLSDVASPYPYFKISTNFWKIKYTNFFMWMQDVRPELTVDGAYKQKYMAMHYLDWNVTKKFNIGLFEAVIWDDANSRGFDVNYVNPLIFYTAVEFATGSRAGNTTLGLSLKYKLKAITLYSQLLLDDFRVGEMTSSSGWWANKFGVQFGAKYYNAFNVENLFLQAEFNAVRPYTYSHDELNLNFGHNNQPLAHLWGANFREAVGIMNYTKNRWFANAKVVVGKKGFDYADGTDTKSYGGDVYADNDDRGSDYGNKIGQGNIANVFIGDLQMGYLVNPATNLKLFGGVTYRKFDPAAPAKGFSASNSTWISFGLKTDVFNWYFDF
ncbi:MAG: gliding motility protein RemB, partial [Lutibacter sp.]|nr:gliding motility protein RemB [Lutibacter sp.]